MRADRTVHGLTFNGGEIVRYDKAGKWYVEHGGMQRVPIGFRDAVRMAQEAGAKAFRGRAGGSAFDRALDEKQGPMREDH